VVAWAVSAEVVMGAQRESALKASEAFRFSQVSLLLLLFLTILLLVSHHLSRVVNSSQNYLTHLKLHREKKKQLAEKMAK
jgi:hypothetical protein